MRALVLNRYGLAGTPYAQWLGDGVSTSIITSAAALSGDEQERRRQLGGYREAIVLPDYNDSPLVEYEAARLHDRQRFDQIVAMSEFDLIRAARLRGLLGIAGQDAGSALAYRDKTRMKDILRAAGIPVAEHAAVDNPTDLLGFARRAGFPLIVKPRLGAGSVGVTRLDSEAGLRAYLAAEPAFRGEASESAGLIAERYIENQLYHVDGLVAGGEAVLCWPSAMTCTLDFCQGDAIVSALLEPGDPVCAALADLTRAVLAALPTPPLTVFHAEIFGTPDGELLLNEIACRVGGGRIRDVLKLAFGVDVHEHYLRALGGGTLPALPPARPARMAGMALFPPRPGVLRTAPPACPVAGVERVSYTHRAGDTLPGPAASSVDALAKVTVSGGTRAQVLASLDEVTRWYAASVQIEPARADLAGAAGRQAR